MVYLRVTYEQDFDDLIMHLRSKYPKQLFEVDGIGDQLDMNKFSKGFFNTNNTADVSVDGNANVADSTVISYHHELPKPFFKMNSYYMLWKGLKKLYNLEVANEIITKQINGDIYINDVHGIAGRLSYCFNYSTYDIAMKGLPMIKKIKSVPPKHLYSFKSQVEQFTIIAANSTLGATGLADFLIIFSWYASKVFDTLEDAHVKFVNIQDCQTYVKETLTSFIYTINQPSRGNQCPFINISIYDDNFLNDMLKDYLFPDGTIPNKNTVKLIQEMYLEIMNEEMERTPITFPITTACFSVDDNNNILDEEFLQMIATFNKEYGFINIFYGSTSTLSSCCFDGDQMVLTKSSNGVKLIDIKTIHEMKWDEKKNFTVYHNGSWCSAKSIMLPYKDKMYKITTSNNKELLVTKDHIHLTIDGDKITNMLTTDDYLAFNSRKLDSFPEKCNNLTYEQGFLIGLYVGDGSKYKRKDCENYEITFSLNENNTDDLKIIKTALTQWGINKEIHIHMQRNTMLTKIYSEKLFNIINIYINGNYAYEKTFNEIIFLESYKFRKGICDGWYASDGGNSNRIYTTSKTIISQAEALFNSIGVNTIVNMSDRTGEDVVVIHGKEFNRNYPLYCIRWYDMKNKRSSKDVYIVKNNTEYFKIKSIETYNMNKEFVYCFEMKNENEPYFTLPNGIITHNCRLRSDKDNEYFNSFGAGSSKIGSLGVVTINLPRLAFKYKNDIDVFNYELKSNVIACARINNVKRKLIQEAIDNGYHPLYTLGFIDINRQYSTVGINGFNECIEILGYDITSEDGTQCGLNIIEIINDINNTCQLRYKFPHNCEQIPGESASIKLAKKDVMCKYNEKYVMYSNQFIPLTTKADMLDRIKLQGIFDKHFSGGSICHVNIDNKIEDVHKIVDLMKLCAKKGVVYWAMNYTLQECENGHMSVGKFKICQVCGKPIINEYTRVVGFLTNTKNWIKERREQDYPNRQWY